MKRRKLNAELLSYLDAILYGVAGVGGDPQPLLDGSALRRLDGLCPIHEEPLITRRPDRCARCLEALLADLEGDGRTG